MMYRLHSIVNASENDVKLSWLAIVVERRRLPGREEGTSTPSLASLRMKRMKEVVQVVVEGYKWDAGVNSKR
jgi:hypothetical protein